MRIKHMLIIGSIFPVLFSLVLFFGVLISAEDDDGGGGAYCDTQWPVLRSKTAAMRS